MKIDKVNIAANIFSTIVTLSVLAAILFGLWGLSVEPGVPLYRRISAVLVCGLFLLTWIGLAMAELVRTWIATFRDTSRPPSQPS